MNDRFFIVSPEGFLSAQYLDGHADWSIDPSHRCLMSLEEAKSSAGRYLLRDSQIAIVLDSPGVWL